MARHIAPVIGVARWGWPMEIIRTWMSAILPGTGRGTSEAGGGVAAALPNPSMLRDAEGTPPPPFGRSPSPGGGGSRPVSLRRSHPCEPIAVHTAASLAPGDHFTGPALVDSSDTTIWVPKGMVARVDPNRTLVIEVSA